MHVHICLFMSAQLCCVVCFPHEVVTLREVEFLPMSGNIFFKIPEVKVIHEHHCFAAAASV